MFVKWPHLPDDDEVCTLVGDDSSILVEGKHIFIVLSLLRRVHHQFKSDSGCSWNFRKKCHGDMKENEERGSIERCKKLTFIPTGQWTRYRST